MRVKTTNCDSITYATFLKYFNFGYTRNTKGHIDLDIKLNRIESKYKFIRNMGSVNIIEIE